MKNLLIMMMVTLLNYPLFANVSKEQQKEFQRKVSKAEQVIKTLLTNDLKQMLGAKELLATVKLEVSQQKVFSEITNLDDDWNEIRSMQLPNMFIDPTQQESLREVKKLELDDIVEHIKEVKVDLATPYDIVDEKLLRQKIIDILVSNISLLRKVKIEIGFSKLTEVFEDNRGKSFARPGTMFDFSNINLDNLKSYLPIVWMVLGFGILFITGLFFAFNKSVYSLKKAVEDKEFTGTLEANLNGLDSVLPGSKEPHPESLFAANKETANAEFTRENYYQTIKHIQASLDGDYSYIEKMIHYSYLLKEHDEMLVLLGLLPSSVRELVYKEMTPFQVKEVKNILINKGERLLQNVTKLCDLSQSIHNIVTLSQMKEDNFYHHYLKRILEGLNTKSLLVVLQAATTSEFYYLIENTSANRIAEVFAKHEDEIHWISSDYVKLDDSEVKPFVEKLTGLFTEEDTFVDIDPRLNIIPHLPINVEKQVIANMSDGEHYQFEVLFEKYFDDIIVDVVSFDFSKLSCLSSLLNLKNKEKLLNKLPELVVERIQSLTSFDHELSLQVKAQLHKKMIKLYLLNSKGSLNDSDVA